MNEEEGIEEFEEVTTHELSDLEQEEIARLVADGYTSGILNDEGVHVSWTLTFSKWKD